jgi:predicted ATPase
VPSLRAQRSNPVLSSQLLDCFVALLLAMTSYDQWDVDIRRTALENFVTISGCSGGGKSTLLVELARRGYATVEEPGRRIVTEELAGEGSALPWVDAVAFARRVVELSLADRAAAMGSTDWVFFDRGLIDAAVALEQATGEAAVEALGRVHRCHRRMFMTPPWPEIYVHDHERRHGLAEAMAEYDRLARAYPSLGYEVNVLPKVGAAERADFVLSVLMGGNVRTAPPPR